MHSKTVKARVYGTVQGVFFRHHTKLKAESLGLGGWVRNCSDGSVETVFQGAAADVKSMIAWLNHGPDSAHVVRLDLDENFHEERLPSSFDIRY